MTIVWSVDPLFPPEGTKVLVAVPAATGLACYEGRVVDAGPIMRIEFDSSVVGADDRGEPQIEAFVDSVYRALADRGNGWCIDDESEEAAAFRAATVMAGIPTFVHVTCTSCGRSMTAPAAGPLPLGGCTDNRVHLWEVS